MREPVSLVEAQKNLEQLCQQAIATQQPITITQEDGQNAVLISEAEFNSLLETLHLLKSPTNAARLLNALERAKANTVEAETVEALCERLGLDEDIVAAS